MPVSIRLLIVGIILVLIDWYFYQAINTVLKGASENKRNVVFYVYWGITVFSFLLFLVPAFFSFNDLPKFVRVYVFAVVVMLLLSKIIGALFLLVDDLIRLFRWIGSYIFAKPAMAYASANPVQNPHAISRLKFLNFIALGMTVIPFAGFLYGMVKGGFNYKVWKERVVLPNLPESFNGLRIVQISDIHSGSFVSTTHIEEAFKLVMDQKADVIFFTGDLVNNIATETEPFLEIFSRLKAPLGVFSTLGNHDYGDYISWESGEAKRQNLESLKNIHAQVGWKLMMNEHVALKRGEDEIALIGVENWGGNLNFPKYGDLKKAHAGTEKYPVKLLLSHDPSHWDKQVRPEYSDIDITFSGHTHGFQMGIEIPGFRWSPSQYVYKEWAGLYTQGKQHLYVNRGLGFLGYPGRIGISPEITVMELYNA